MFFCPKEQYPILYVSGILCIITLILALKSFLKLIKEKRKQDSKKNEPMRIKIINQLIYASLSSSFFGAIFIIIGFFSAVPILK